MPQIPKSETDLAAIIADLQRRLSALETARPLESAVIGKGGISVKDGGSISVYDQNTGNRVFYIGRAGFNSTPSGGYTDQMVTIVSRSDGRPAIYVADLDATPGHAYKQSFQVFDSPGHVVFADDENSGVARPYIPLGPFEDITSTSMPITTSATFADLQWCSSYRQHPKAVFSLIIYSSDGTTTGTVQIVDGGGNVIGSPVSVAASAFTTAGIGPVAWPVGTWGGPDEVLSGTQLLRLQAKRTAGAGNIGAKVIGAFGVQS